MATVGAVRAVAATAGATVAVAATVPTAEVRAEAAASIRHEPRPTSCVRECPPSEMIWAMYTVSWTRMEDGSKADYEMLSPTFEEHTRGQLVDNLIGMLDLLKGPKLGYQVDRYVHSLQSGTRALRNGESPDMIVGALLHDVADAFAPENHSEAAAALLRPYVDERTHWVVQHHGIFQGYYYFHHLGGDRDARERYADSPYYDDCIAFCDEYDQNCFDPAYDTLPIEEFRPYLDEVFSRPSRVPGVAPLEA